MHCNNLFCVEWMSEWVCLLGGYLAMQGCSFSWYTCEYPLSIMVTQEWQRFEARVQRGYSVEEVMEVCVPFLKVIVKHLLHRSNECCVFIRCLKVLLKFCFEGSNHWDCRLLIFSHYSDYNFDRCHQPQVAAPKSVQACHGSYPTDEHILNKLVRNPSQLLLFLP